MTIEETTSTPRHRRVWPRALAGIGLVAVVGAGLGAYLGIRGVVGSGSAPSTNQPPARTNASMAFDAADNTVVLFGGQGKSRSLGDTWTWDGSSWTQQHPSTSPPALAGAQMTYDPVSHDLMLVGGERLAGTTISTGICSSAGSSGSGSATGSSGSSTKWIPPAAPIPAVAPVPGGELTTPPISTGCDVSDGANSSTWLWNGTNWARASGSTPPVGFGEWNLATDPVSGRALLLADQSLVAEPDAPIVQPRIECPMQTTVTDGATAQPACPVFPVALPQSWMWTGQAWKVLPATPRTSPIDMFGAPVIDDAVSGHLAVFGSEFIPTSIAPCPTCATGAPIRADQAICCSGTVSVWNGTSWKQAGSFTDGPMVSGGTFVGDAATHSDVSLTTDGQTWVWTGVWTRRHPATTPTALEGSTSAYDAATGQVVVFGGLGTTGRSTGLYDQTWTWDGSDWTMRGGSASPAVSIPVPSPVSLPPSTPCDVPPPTTPPDYSGPQPQYACSGGSPGSTGGGNSSAGSPPVSAGGTSASSGIIAP